MNSTNAGMKISDGFGLKIHVKSQEQSKLPANQKQA
jgi:hypothetical protein